MLPAASTPRHSKAGINLEGGSNRLKLCQSNDLVPATRYTAFNRQLDSWL